MREVSETAWERGTIAGAVVRTPLVRLSADDLPAEVYLKLENLQPVGSFKIRGAYNAMARLPRPGDGQPGNMAQGLAWCARERGIPCTVVVPEQAPETKLGAWVQSTSRSRSTNLRRHLLRDGGMASPAA